MSNYFFVYGTLRPGEVRWHIIADAVMEEPKRAIMENCAIFNMGSYPALMLNTEGSVIGDLVQIKPDLVDRITRTLDQIEGFYADDPKGSLYTRTKEKVITDDGTVVAWVYQAGDHIRDSIIKPIFRAPPRIESGDWKQR